MMIFWIILQTMSILCIS